MDSINAMIAEAGWYPGTEADWDRLSGTERRELAFAATGCEIAFPTWRQPVNCCHTGCQVRRGELPAIALTNRILRSEMHHGWLRFLYHNRLGRSRLASFALQSAMQRESRESMIHGICRVAGARL